MAQMMLKTAHHAKATAHRVATAQPVASAVSVLNVLKARSVRMTALKHVRKVVLRNAAKAAIHATNVGMIAAHAVTKQAKLHKTRLQRL